MTEDTTPFSAASFYRYLGEAKLMASRSKATGKLFLPPRAICPDTFEENMEWVELSGAGTLVAFTVVHFGLSRMIGHDRENPYCTGIVELDEGIRISARILEVDVQHPEAITIGTRVQVTHVGHIADPEQDPVLCFRLSV